MHWLGITLLIILVLSPHVQVLPDYTKLYASSGLRLTLSADGRNYRGSAGEADCCRHYFTINGQECQNPGTIEGTHVTETQDVTYHRPFMCKSSSIMGRSRSLTDPNGLLAKIVHHESRLSIFRGCWPPTPEDILDPSHGRVFREKFRSVYVVKGCLKLAHRSVIKQDMIFSFLISFYLFGSKQKSLWKPCQELWLDDVFEFRIILSLPMVYVSWYGLSTPLEESFKNLTKTMSWNLKIISVCVWEAPFLHSFKSFIVKI